MLWLSGLQVHAVTNFSEEIHLLSEIELISLWDEKTEYKVLFANEKAYRLLAN